MLMDPLATLQRVLMLQLGHWEESCGYTIVVSDRALEDTPRRTATVYWGTEVLLDLAQSPVNKVRFDKMTAKYREDTELSLLEGASVPVLTRHVPKYKDNIVRIIYSASWSIMILTDEVRRELDLDRPRS